MMELIDLIIYQLRDEPNQEIAIFYCGNEWIIDAVNTCQHVMLGEADGKYRVIGPTLLEALNHTVEITK